MYNKQSNVNYSLIKYLRLIIGNLRYNLVLMSKQKKSH